MKSKMTYRDRLRQVQELNVLNKKSIGGNAYDRVSLLAEVFEDRAYPHDMGNIDDAKADDELSKFIADLPAGFLSMRAVLERFNERSDWETRGPRELYFQLKEETDALKPQRQKRSHKSVTVKEHERVVNELGEHRAMLKHSQSELSILRKENQELKEENAMLKGRIAELEKSVERLSKTRAA